MTDEVDYAHTHGKELSDKIWILGIITHIPVVLIFAAAKKLKTYNFELTRLTASSTIRGFYLVYVERWEVIINIDTQSLSFSAAQALNVGCFG